MKKLILAVILTLSGVLGAHAAVNTPTFTPTQSLTPTFYPGSLAQRQDIAALQAALKAGVPALPLSNTPTWQPSASMTTTLTPTITSTNTRVEVYIRLTDTPTPTITPTFNSALLTASPTPFTPTLTPYVKGGRAIVPGENPSPISNVVMIPPTTTPSIIPTPWVLPAQSPGMVYKVELYCSNQGSAPLTFTTATAISTKNYYFGIGDIRALQLIHMSGGPATYSVGGAGWGLGINGDIAVVPKNP